MLFSCGAKQESAAKPELKTFPEQYSYVLGLDIGESLKRMNSEVDLNALAWGMADIMKNRTQLMTPAVLDSIKRLFSMKMQQQQMADQQKQMQEMKPQADKNAKEGAAFLAENKKKPGVITTKSGLQYKIIKKGTGPMPKPTDKVKVNYEGKFIDGKIFDSSAKQGQPAEFPVGQIIPGWSEALQLMPVGSKYELYIPSNIAYGEQGRPPVIGPNALLIFQVELLDIEK